MFKKKRHAFPNYMEVRQFISNRIWHVIRGVSSIVFFWECYLLVFKPSLGLWLFWSIFVPFAPLIFFVIPGLWRNMCPLASANQLPREMRWSLNLTIPNWLHEYGYVIAIGLLFLIIPARKFLFDNYGISLAILMLIFVFFAFVGGLLFKGKSGWCASVCPLLPIQQIYGQTPLINIRNYHCRPCVGCVENCYDFNPSVAYAAQLNNKKKHYVNYRLFFVASLPGIIWGYFTIPAYPILSIAGIYLAFLSSIMVSSFVFFCLLTFIKVDPLTIASIYGAVAFSLFYWFVIPIMVLNIETALGLSFPLYTATLLYLGIVILTLVWLAQTLLKQKNILNFIGQTKQVQVANLGTIKSLHKKRTEVVPIAFEESNKQFLAKKGQSLLSILENYELPIQAGCRMGFCGADPVTIVEGAETLHPPSDNEKMTLKRLGLAPHCRMACSVYIRQPMKVSLHPTYVEADDKQKNTANWVDKSIKRVVIIGNGIAGMTVAERIHQYYPDCEIFILGKENYDLYNRIGLTSIIAHQINMDSLNLMPPSWYKKPFATSMHNTQVVRLNVHERQVVLSDQSVIDYDKLVLAMGSRSLLPHDNNKRLSGIFVFREAEDVIALNNYIKKNNCKNIVVLGGGVLGVEIAYALIERLLHVSLVHHSSHLLNKQIDSVAGNYLHFYLEENGCKLYCSNQIESIQGRDKITSVTLMDGTELPCDVLIYSIGMVPNAEIAHDVGLATDVGVIVNEKLCSSDPNIYACGDVAQLSHGVEGLWTASAKQAEIVAINLLGGDEIYKPMISTVVLKISGIHVASIGRVISPSSDDKVIVIEHAAERLYKKLIISKENVLVGAILIGYSQQFHLISRAIEKGLNVEKYLDEINEDHFSEPWLD